MAIRATLTITLDDAGQVQVTGPILDKIACYGLLAMAADVIRAYDPKTAPLIVPASTLPGNGRSG